jgi:hypothetical protein
MRVSSIISCVSKKMDNFESLYGIESGVKDENVASGETVKMTEA